MVSTVRRERAVKREEVYQKVLEMAQNVAKNKTGGLFIIGPKNKFQSKYNLLYPRIICGGNILDKGMDTLVENFSLLDGALVISDEGELVDIGAMIKKVKPISGFGTKHAAAAGITESIKGSTAVLVPEKMEWIKVFQEGKIILEMDSTKRPVSHMAKIVSFLTDHDTTIVTTAGISAALLGLGPVLVISGAYLAVKTATGIVQKSMKKVK